MIENFLNASQISYNSNADFEADSPLSESLGYMLNSTLLVPSFDDSKLVLAVLCVAEHFSRNIKNDCSFTAGLLHYKLPLKLISLGRD